MKFTTLQTVLGSAALLSSLPLCSAGPNHRRAHLLSSSRHHSHSHQSPAAASTQSLAKRGQCAFPTDEPDLVAVTPDAENAGWAMSPDQPCKPGSYCPYACKPGMVMAQWDPDSTYTYPASMNGGLFCDKSGTMQKPFPKKLLCVPGTGAVQAVNQAGSPLSWCQTVLPGNEAMLIPTLVTSSITVAVPSINYWQGTAAHYYVNPPGTGVEGCIWGESSKPIGNWSPYVAGANTDASGNTFVKIGINPIWFDCPLKDDKPSYGLKIECPDGGCNGLPCAIEPGTGEVKGGGTTGAGGGAFCVVTVPPGGTAHIIAYGGDGGGDSDSGSDSDSDSDSSDDSTPTEGLDAAAFADRPEKSSSKSSTTAAAAEHSTTAAAENSSSTTTTITESTTSAEQTTATASHHTSSAFKSKKGASSTSSAMSSETDSMTSTTLQARPTLRPGIFHENNTASATGQTQQPTATQAVAAPSLTHKAEAVRHSGGGAFAGLVIAFIATACLF